jgi:hypothetical protein
MQAVMWQQPNRPQHHAHHGRQGCLIIEQAFAPEIVMPSSWKNCLLHNANTSALAIAY